MTAPVIALGTERARSCRLYVPWTGAPVASLHFDHVITPPNGKTTLQVGDISLVGVALPSQSGDYALSSHVTFVGGAGGWGKTLSSRAYHNDAPQGVDASQIASDAATEVGETIVVDASVSLITILGNDYEREGAEASRVIEGLFSGAVWWVDATGVTHVGTRTGSDVSTLTSLLHSDPRLGFAVLIADDLRNVLPGNFFSDVRLSAPFTIHDVTIDAEGPALRAYAFSSSQRDSRFLSLFDQLVRRTTPNAKFERGPYRFRVTTLADDRVNLQAVNTKLNLPDPLPVSISPGMAGLSTQLTLGCVVLVDFIEGDPSMPIITHFTKKGDPGFLPVSVSIDAVNEVDVGKTALRTIIGKSVPANPAMSAQRYLRVGDVITNTGASGPMPLVLDPSSPTMSTAGTT